MIRLLATLQENDLEGEELINGIGVFGIACLVSQLKVGPAVCPFSFTITYS